MTKPVSLTTDVIRQHTVPRFLLEQFAGQGKGKRRRLHAFDKHSERAYSTNPFDATVRNAFYNLDDHPDRLSLEPLMAIYETDAAPVIHRLLAHRDIRQLSVDDRYNLAVFVAVQRGRTYGEQKRIEDFVSAITDKLAAIGASPYQSAEALGFSPERDARNLFLGQLVQQVSYIEHIQAKDWYLYETSSDHPFYISDSPVVLHNDNSFGPYGNLGLALAGIQIYLPLSSTLTLAMLCPSIRQRFVAAKSDLQRILTLAPQQLPSTIDPDKFLKTADSYINYETSMATPDQVMWQNSLQVRFSEQYVFCEKDDFSLVRKMIADNQGFKSGMRIKVG